MVFQVLSEGWKWLPWWLAFAEDGQGTQMESFRIPDKHLQGASNCRAETGKSWLAPLRSPPYEQE